MTTLHRAQNGIALVGLLVILLGVAALSVVLSERTAPERHLTETVAATDRLRYAVGAAAAHGRWALAQNQTCSDYVDPPAAQFAGHQYSATVAPRLDSPVQLAVAVTSPTGASRDTVIEDVIMYSLPDTVRIEAVPEDKDTEIESADGKQDHNHFDRDELEAGGSRGDGDRVLLEMALPTLPPRTRVNTATLTLNIVRTKSSNATFEIRRLTQDWDEEDVNWIQRQPEFFGIPRNWRTPGGDVAREGASTFVVSTIGAVDVDVTDIVRAWVDGEDNYGFLIQGVLDDTDRRIEIASGQYPDPALRPLLIIDFACECGSTCAVAPPEPVGALVSFAGDVAVDGNRHAPGDAFDLDPGIPVSIEVLKAGEWLSPATANVDAIHRLDAQRFLISTDSTVTADSQTFQPHEVFELDIATGTVTPYWTGAAVSPGLNLNALALRTDGRLAWSVASAGSVNGLSVEADDISLYNSTVNGVARWIDVDPAVADGSANVDALHVFDNGSLVLSVDATETIAGVVTDPDDLLLVPPSGPLSLFFDNGPVVSTDASAPDIDATTFSLGTDPDEGDTLAASAASARNCEGSYADRFFYGSFDNNDGSNDFASPWIEIGESDGARFGDIRQDLDLGDARLRVRDADNGGEGVRRSFDLTVATNATLSMDVRRRFLDNNNDYVALAVSTDGDNWDELDRFQGPDNDDSYQPKSYDLTPYRSATTQIRLLSGANLGGLDIVYFDNVSINFSGCP